MTFGADFQAKVNAIINNPALRSTVTIIAITKNEGSFGGYDAAADTTVSTVATYGIPTEYIKELDVMPYGSLTHGTTSITVKGTESIDEETYNYNITWQGISYQVKKVDRLMLNDVIACIVLGLVRNV